MTKIQSLHGTTVAEVFAAGFDSLEQIEAVDPLGVAVMWSKGV